MCGFRNLNPQPIEIQIPAPKTAILSPPPSSMTSSTPLLPTRPSSNPPATAIQSSPGPSSPVISKGGNQTSPLKSVVLSSPVRSAARPRSASTNTSVGPADATYDLPLDSSALSSLVDDLASEMLDAVEAADEERGVVTMSASDHIALDASTQQTSAARSTASSEDGQTESKPLRPKSGPDSLLSRAGSINRTPAVASSPASSVPPPLKNSGPVLPRPEPRKVDDEADDLINDLAKTTGIREVGRRSSIAAAPPRTGQDGMFGPSPMAPTILSNDEIQRQAREMIVQGKDRAQIAAWVKTQMALTQQASAMAHTSGQAQTAGLAVAGQPVRPQTPGAYAQPGPLAVAPGFGYSNSNNASFGVPALNPLLPGFTPMAQYSSNQFGSPAAVAPAPASPYRPPVPATSNPAFVQPRIQYNGTYQPMGPNQLFICYSCRYEIQNGESGMMAASRFDFLLISKLKFIFVRYYHTNCLKCGRCSRDISTEDFFPVTDKLYCSNCFSAHQRGQ